MKDFQTLFSRLKNSKYRTSFSLRRTEVAYLQNLGLDKVLEDGRFFLKTRITPARPHNDGKQTPKKGHPIFVAQHATATCCRACIESYHGIPKGRALTFIEEDYILSLLEYWIGHQNSDSKIVKPKKDTNQPSFL